MKQRCGGMGERKGGGRGGNWVSVVNAGLKTSQQRGLEADQSRTASVRSGIHTDSVAKELKGQKWCFHLDSLITFTTYWINHLQQPHRPPHADSGQLMSKTASNDAQLF